MLKNGVIQQCDKLAKITKYLHRGNYPDYEVTMNESVRIG